MSRNKNEEIVDLVTDIAYKFKRLEDLLGVPLNSSHSNLAQMKKPEPESKPEIKTFNVSNYNSESENSDNDDDDESNVDDVDEYTDVSESENESESKVKVVKKSSKKKSNGGTKKKKTSKKKSTKKKQPTKKKTVKKGGKGNAFTKYMGKKIKELKKKHPKKTHGEIFKLAASEYKKK